MAKQILNTESPISSLHSIAAKLESDFDKLGIDTIGDLLWYFPWRYDDLSEIKTIQDLAEGEVATIKVIVNNIKTYRSPRRKLVVTQVKTSDDTGKLEAVWFGQKFISQVLKEGDEIYLSGKSQIKTSKTKTMASPYYEKVKDDLNKQIHSARLVPNYHLSGKITQKQLRFLIDRALKVANYQDDPLPVEILNKEKFIWLHEALQEIHFPTEEKKLEQAGQRLKFQELFYLQAKYQLAAKSYKQQPSFVVPINNKLLEQNIKSLPFELTDDQRQTLGEVIADMTSPHPMNRLIEGDVGSGKTIIALLAAINTMSHNTQTAMMAPTEILAQQHFANMQKIFPKNQLSQIALLTKDLQILGNNKVLTKKNILEKIANNNIKFVVGTHSLIQDKINFDKLGLVIIDEQHRFGVKQRQAIKDKSQGKEVPHLLSMTATPIPRTLSLTLYGDLDISIIKQKPAGRQEIKTHLIPDSKREDGYQFILDKIKQNQQVFVVCPLIDKSDKLGVKSVTQEYNKLNKEIFPDLDIRMLHGKLKTEAKKKIMDDFQANKFPILVSTSVIEVGVDIPNATVMWIESAERFGLSQLHQFRGRIGRNKLASFCLLFTTDKNKLNTTRLKALTKSNDGFELSELDLELRGAGEIFGTQQTGLMRLKIAKLSDTALIKKAQKWAKEIINNKKYLSQQQLQKILKNLKTEMHLE